MASPGLRGRVGSCVPAPRVQGGRLGFGAMVDGQSEAQASAQLHLACGRVLGSARAIAQAHRFGVPEGPHRHPWTVAYLREAVGIYAESLPVSYQRHIVSLFRQCISTMASRSIPSTLAEDWLIVNQHLTNAGDSMAQLLAAQPEPAGDESTDRLDIEDHEPPVVRFDRLAALTTTSGARRLEQAALAVQGHVGSRVIASLDGEQRRLLRAVASGASVADVAADLGYSPRSAYRALTKLWRDLGVPNRAQGIRKATAEGLLD